MTCLHLERQINQFVLARAGYSTKQTAAARQYLSAGLLSGIQTCTRLDKDRGEHGALGFMSKIWTNIDSK